MTDHTSGGWPIYHGPWPRRKKKMAPPSAAEISAIMATKAVRLAISDAYQQGYRDGFASHEEVTR